MCVRGEGSGIARRPDSEAACQSGKAARMRPGCGDAKKKRLTDLSDAVGAAAIEMNAEFIDAQSSQDYMWPELAPPTPVAAPKMDGSAMKRFGQMPNSGLWVIRGKTQKGYAVYLHVIRCNGSMRTIYASMGEDKEPKFPEIANRMATRRYSACEARRGAFSHPARL